MKRLFSGLALVLALGLVTALPAPALSRYDLPQVKRLTFHVEDGARRVKLYAENFAGAFDPAVRRMIYSLYQCEVAAASFRQVVDYWWRDRFLVERALRRLQFAVADVDRAIYMIRPMGPALGEWRRTTMEMRQVDYLMARPDGGPGHGPGHGGSRDLRRVSSFETLYLR